MNTRLKLAILNCGKPQYLLAHLLGMSETRLSRIVSGRRTPTPEERASLAHVTGQDERDLFGPTI